MSADRTLPEAPRALEDGGEWQVGIYRTPFAVADMKASGWQRYRLKEWHYVSFTTDAWYVAVGLVQAGYVGNLFAYVVDRASTAAAPEFASMSPMGRMPRFAPSSVQGTTTWVGGGATVSVTADQGWEVSLDVPIAGERLTGVGRVEARESLAMLHRLAPNRVAYTHKAAGWPASGELSFGDARIPLDGGLAASDWTRSQALRLTEWKWCSLSGFLADGRAFGLNLSADVYDDASGNSVENAMWIDGRVTPLSGVRFEVPQSPRSEPWRIVSMEGDSVDLSFTPLGAREEHLNFGLVRSDFVQPYGRFSGQVRGHDVTGSFGVVETHRSLW